MGDAILYAWRETIRRKNRSLWNILGYLVAVAFLVVSITTIGLSSDATQSSLANTGTQFIGFYPKTFETASQQEIQPLDPENEGFVASNTPSMLFSRELIEKMNQSPNVKYASPFLSFRIQADGSDRSLLMAGFDPNDMEAVTAAGCSATNVVEGRFLQPGDSGVVLLEQTYAESMKLKSGQTIKLGQKDFRIIGVVSPGTRPAKADVYMSITEAEKVINGRLNRPLNGLVNIVLVDGANSTVHPEAITDVKGILGKNGMVSGYGCFKPAGLAVGLTQDSVGLITILIGLSVILLAMRSQYSSVLERKHDIGILKAIGWSNTNVVRQIMSESIIQAIIGGVLGCLAAILILMLLPVNEWFDVETAALPLLSPAILLYGLLLPLVAGVLSGLVPARSAARMKPADILRML